MTKFNQINFTKFVADYSIINGELVDEFALNLSPQRLKKEINNMYNIVNILNGNRILNWSPVEYYLVGELVQNESADDKYYRARKVSENKRPDLFSDFWEEASNKDYTEYGDFTNFLAKDNTEPYSPAGQYNPATKGYIDFALTKKLDLEAKAQDSYKLNGEVVTNVLGNSLTKPASQKLVQQVHNEFIDEVNSKLDASEFNATNVMSMVQNVDGAGTGLDADYLDGQSSEYFMKVGTATNFNTMKTPGSYLFSPGGTGAPDSVGTYALVVTGTGTYFSQIATSVTENKLYYRSFVTSWSAWKEFASSTGSIATADKLSSPVTITLSGDATGSTSFDGSNNVTINTTVINDSHTHDNRYYTENEQDARFLPLHAKADNADKLDNLNSTQFLRSDIGGVVSGDVTIAANLLVTGDTTFEGYNTTIEADTLKISDKNIELGVCDNPTDDTANGGGIILLGATNKSITYNKTNNKWMSSIDIEASHFLGIADNSNLLDGYDSSKNADANTVTVRDSSGDINARLFRSEYDLTNSSIGYIMTQVNTDTNNYIRPSTPAQLVNALPASDLLDKINSVAGEGSELDADLLDGLDSDEFLRSNEDDTMEGNLSVVGSITAKEGHDNGFRFPNDVYGGSADTATITVENPDGGENTQLILAVTNDADDKIQIKTPSNTGFLHNNNTVWTAGNDGSGSGLDADKLDGYNSSIASNVSTVTVRDSSGDINARLFRSEYDSTNSSIGYIMTQIDTASNNYIRPSTPAQLVNGLPASNLLTKLKTVDGSGSGLDADLLDGVNSSQFLRSDVTDYQTNTIYTRGYLVAETSYRDRGIYGTYDSSKTQHIWSMGTAYKNASNGTNFGNLYGLAYKYNLNSSGHGIHVVSNGTVQTSLGNNIWCRGNITAYSDVRVKENLEIIPDALSKIQQINGYTYDRSDVQNVTAEDKQIIQEHNKSGRHMGVIAQELIKVIPEVVLGGPTNIEGTEDDHYSVAYGNITALLIEGIKEQQQIIKKLENRISKLEGN